VNETGKWGNGEKGKWFPASIFEFRNFHFPFPSFEKPLINRLMKRGAVMLSEAKHLLSH